MRCPPAFADRIGLAAHQKAADYTVARMRLGIAEMLVEAALLVVLTLGGGLAVLVALDRRARRSARWAATSLLIVAVAVISGVVSLPFSYGRRSASRRGSASTGRRASCGSPISQGRRGRRRRSACRSRRS